MNPNKKIASILLVFSCLNFSAQYLHENLKIMRVQSYAYDKAEAPEKYDLSYTYKNLRIYPIIANEKFINQHQNIGDFLLLKQ